MRADESRAKLAGSGTPVPPRSGVEPTRFQLIDSFPSPRKALLFKKSHPPVSSMCPVSLKVSVVAPPSAEKLMIGWCESQVAVKPAAATTEAGDEQPPISEGRIGLSAAGGRAPNTPKSLVSKFSVKSVCAKMPFCPAGIVSELQRLNVGPLPPFKTTLKFEMVIAAPVLLSIRTAPESNV